MRINVTANKMFLEQICQTMEVPVDDILVKLRKLIDHMEHLSKIFNVLWKYGMKLNIFKCSFEIALKKYLGFIVNSRDI